MSNSVFQGRRFLITSGPMRAPIDAIRYMANTSTGRLGSHLALEALRRGHRVTFVYGPGGVCPQADDEPPWEERLVLKPVVTFDDFMKVMSQELSRGEYHVVLHAMAVLDYVPEKRHQAKMPSGQSRWTITLVPTPKIIEMIKRWDPDLFLVGFKLEVGGSQKEMIEATTEVARKSGADLMVANELGQIQEGHHRAVVVDGDGRLVGTFHGKEQIAHGLLDLIEERLKGER